MSKASSSATEVRRLWLADKEAFRHHLLSLDPRSRHLRFGGGMSDDFLIRYAENCFGKSDLIYGAFIDGDLVGAAELRSNQAIWSEQAPFGRHIHAEAAFSVDNGYRRRGIGEKLFKRILRAATNHGVETIEMRSILAPPCSTPTGGRRRTRGKKARNASNMKRNRHLVRLPVAEAGPSLHISDRI
jgi:GNAT superfamily N-acetyltransferase